ncbi:MAG: outer membrane beta-barrel protein [Candidatus Sulfotelmatobacter sp.]|jgi:opacity protein-like surface antigen
MFERCVKIVGLAAPICSVKVSSAAICQIMLCAIMFCPLTTGVVQAQQAQQAPEAPKPAAAPAEAQENPEVETPARRVKPRLYRTWLFNAGGGANLPNGTTEQFVRGGGPAADVGAARNFSKYFGFRMDFSWTDLPLRTSALQLAQAPGANNHVYGLTFDPVVYIPVTSVYSGYALVGPGFYHRTGKIDSSTAVPGGSCNPFWDWWGTCLNRSLPLGTFLKESQNQFGFNFGGGIARKVTDKIDIYAEYRALHGSRNGNTTDARTLTLGVRW